MCDRLSNIDKYALVNYKEILPEIENYWVKKVNDENKKQQIKTYINNLKSLIENQYLSPNTLKFKQAFVAQYYTYYQMFIINGEFLKYFKYFQNIKFPLDITGKCKNVVISNLLIFSYKFDDNYDNYFTDTGNDVQKGRAYTEIEEKINEVKDIGAELVILFDKLNIQELLLDGATSQIFSKVKINSTNIDEKDVLPYHDWFGLGAIQKILTKKINIPGVNVF